MASDPSPHKAFLLIGVCITLRVKQLKMGLLSFWALRRGIQDFQDFQEQRGQQEILESPVPQEAGASVALKDKLVLQDAEVWLVQNEEFHQLLLNIWTERPKDLTTIE